MPDKKIELIENLLKKMSVEFDVVEKKESDLPDYFRYVVNTPEAAILIGNKGETLGALSHLFRKMAEKNQEQDLEENFFIDIGDYQNRRIQDIKNKAIVLAERARFFKKDVEMPPMNSYERMITHSFFTDQRDIETESQGQDQERRVIIKYIGN